jgi:ABC-type nitrate/sulfonate/bicarbonate transport system permease component
VSTPGTDPEQVLSQALRAMAGGGRRAEPASAGPGRSWWARLTTLQVVLLALIAGASIGMIAGIVVLLTR